MSASYIIFAPVRLSKGWGHEVHQGSLEDCQRNDDLACSAAQRFAPTVTAQSGGERATRIVDPLLLGCTKLQTQSKPYYCTVVPVICWSCGVCPFCCFWPFTIFSLGNFSDQRCCLVAMPSCVQVSGNAEGDRKREESVGGIKQLTRTLPKAWQQRLFVTRRPM